MLFRSVAGASVDADVPLMDAGVDSLGAVELRNQLQRAAGEGASLPSTLVFEHPTARRIAASLQPEELAPLEQGQMSCLMLPALHTRLPPPDSHLMPPPPAAIRAGHSICR